MVSGWLPAGTQDTPDLMGITGLRAIQLILKEGVKMSFKVTDNVTWVGKIDWELKKFHGEEYSTQGLDV